MKNVPLRPSNYASMHPFCTIYFNLKFAKSIGKYVFFVYSPFSEATFTLVCFIKWLRTEISTFVFASGLILCKNARRTRYFKSESSCNTCFGSPTYKQINTISVLFPAVQAVTISSSCNRRLLIACFPSPIGNCMQSINCRAAVCPPQTAFN